MVHQYDIFAAILKASGNHWLFLLHPFPLDAILELSKLPIDFAKSRWLHSLGLDL